MKRHAIAVVAALLVLPVIGACTSLQGGARLEHWPGNQDPAPTLAFRGVLLGEPRTDAAGASVTSTGEITRFVFNIHGMGFTEDSYNDVMTRWLTRDFGYVPDSNSANGEADGWVHVRLADDHTVSGEGLVCLPTAREEAAQRAELHPINCRYETFGRYKVERLIRRVVGRPAERLIIYTYYWHEDLWRIQEPYMYEDLERPRALINGPLKRDLVDRGLSDAAAYLGTMRPIVIDGVRGALCAMLTEASGQQTQTETVEVRTLAGFVSQLRSVRRDEGQPILAGTDCLAAVNTDQLGYDVEFNFISHSLGSRMLLDALTPYAADSASAASGLNERLATLAAGTRTLFMAANQIPLFGVASLDIETVRTTPIAETSSGRAPPAREDDDAPEAAGVSDEPCRGSTFFSCAPDPEITPTGAEIRLDVVAFIDPDDILGYSANGGMLGVGAEGSYADHQMANIHFVSVRHRNTPQWLWTLSWPSAAHDRELHNRSSVDLIFCGATVRGDRPIPRRSRGGGCELDP